MIRRPPAPDFANSFQDFLIPFKGSTYEITTFISAAREI